MDFAIEVKRHGYGILLLSAGVVIIVPAVVTWLGCAAMLWCMDRMQELK